MNARCAPLQRSYRHLFNAINASAAMHSLPRLIRVLTTSAALALASTSEAATLNTLAPTNVTATSATFNGTAVGTGDTEQLWCDVWTPSRNFASTFMMTPATISGTTSATLTASRSDLLPDTTYNVQIRSVRLSDNAESLGEILQFTTPRLLLPPTVASFSFLFSLLPTSVTATGSVSTGTDTTSIFWDLGLTTDYGQTIPGTPATEPGNLSTSVAIRFTGLQPSTTYHYRIRATNVAGTAVGNDYTFTTTAGPTVSTLAAIGVTDLTATLKGSCTPDNRQGIVSFDLGTTTAYEFFPSWSKGYATPVSVSGTNAVAITKTVGGLLPNTTYHYRLHVDVGNTETYLGNDMTFTTGAPSTPPSASGSTASPVGSLAATLSVSASAGAAPATALFEFGLDTSYTMPNTPAEFSYYDFNLNHSVTMSTLNAGAGASAMASFNGLTPSTTYHYRLKITSGLGTAYSPDATFTTNGPPASLVTTPALAWAPTSVQLRGSFNPQGLSFTKHFEYGSTTAYGSSVSAVSPSGLIAIGGSSPEDLVATIAGLTPGATYHCRFVVTDASGGSFSGNDVAFTTPATPIEGWRAQHFQTFANTGSAADDATPSSDGVSNLMKYALNMDPTKPGTTPQPQLQSFLDGDALSLSFTRDRFHTDVSYEVQAAENLAGPWTTVATATGGGLFTGPGVVSDSPPGLILGFPILITTIPSPPTNNSTATVRDTVVTSAASRRFMRLRVTKL